MGLRRFFGPKNRVDSEFVHFVDENDEVMREHLTKRFVDNSNVRLATQAVPKLAFHHAERGFNIGPLLVVLQRVIPPALKVVVHLRPRSAAIPAMARAKEIYGVAPSFANRIGVCPRSVTFVRRDFRNLKVFRRGCYQSGQHFGIARVPTMDFNGGHDIGFHPHHDVALNPIMLLLTIPYLWSNQRVKWQVVKPEESTANPLPRDFRSKLLWALLQIVQQSVSTAHSELYRLCFLLLAESFEQMSQLIRY